MSKVTVDREIVTPTIAKQYLEANVHNRSFRKAWAAQLAGAIKRGEWRETGDPIQFNGDGSLVNGQHRLAAIAKAGKRVPVWVARGVVGEAQEVIDIGSKRTQGDMLKLRGYADGNNLASIATVVWLHRAGGSPVIEQSLYVRPTPQQILQLIEEEPSLVERVRFARRFKSQDPAFPLSVRFVGGLFHIFAELTSEEDAATFFGELLTPPSATSPTGLVRARLLRASTVHSKMPVKVQVALVIKAWNAWVQGDRPTRLTWRAGGAKKEEFPTIQGMVE